MLAAAGRWPVKRCQACLMSSALHESNVAAEWIEPISTQILRPALPDQRGFSSVYHYGVQAPGAGARSWMGRHTRFNRSNVSNSQGTAAVFLSQSPRCETASVLRCCSCCRVRCTQALSLSTPTLRRNDSDAGRYRGGKVVGARSQCRVFRRSGLALSDAIVCQCLLKCVRVWAARHPALNSDERLNALLFLPAPLSVRRHHYRCRIISSSGRGPWQDLRLDTQC
ncbi:uncharacterized protein C8Q71DRAFT_522745 [Rhodofomes roseus]|uniref:Uncharacterized protein n=1 Tax=Rhodofomes roseus TaxID=34475 RepID=A0ABQ8KK23_9APHY|nr:uncharacterized protein C8Q71DRAFT_522745 [Rhodofomes roseus]KAH9838319.1 hypothetical protein C8Q71DRAFT_522745 [Rhodofomes roseus]